MTKTQKHYGLEFALKNSTIDIQAAIDRLAKKNRIKKAIITELEKPALRHQLKERMKVRRRREDQRYTQRFK